MTTNFASKYINKNVITQNRCTVKKFSLKKIDIFSKIQIFFILYFQLLPVLSPINYNLGIFFIEMNYIYLLEF